MRNRTFNVANETPPNDVAQMSINLIQALGLPAGTNLNQVGIGKGVWTGIRTALMTTQTGNPNCDYIQISFGATKNDPNDPNFQIIVILEGMYQNDLNIATNEYENYTSEGRFYASSHLGGPGGGNGMLAVPPPTP